MSEHSHCPHCGTSFQGNPIPEESRQYYGTTTHFRRDIGVEIMGQYDGVLYWKCPDCGWAFQRWPEGHYLHDRAEQFINQNNLGLVNP